MRRLVLAVAIVLAVASCTSEEEADLQRSEEEALREELRAQECADLEAMTAAELRQMAADFGQDLEELRRDIEDDCGQVPESGEDTESAELEPITLRGSFEYEAGTGTEVDRNEVELTVTVEGDVSESGLIETVTRFQDEARGCGYDYSWLVTFTIEGRLLDAEQGAGTAADLQVTSSQQHPRKNVEDGCPVQILMAEGRTTAVGELRLTEPASMTAEIEPAASTPFVHIPTFSVEQ